MSSTQRNSSITSSSILIPNWVKNKFENSGFDPSTLSPPTHDSEFFYVKFPKSDKSETNHQFEGIQSSEKFTDHIIGKTQQQFIPIIPDPVKPNIMKAVGLEDGTITQKIISGGKSPVRGFTTDDTNDKPSGSYLRQRRNSKSLPSSPLTSPETSPRTRRKNATTFALQNRFPAGSIAATSLVEADENPGKKLKSSWLLSGLFSLSKESGLIAKSGENSVAAEGQRVEEESRGLSNRMNLNVKVDMKPSGIIDKKDYMKKRSEIRELNFMSPVSM